ALNHNPGDIIGGIVVIALLAVLNVRGLGESAKLNLVLAVVDLGTQILLVLLGCVLVLDPSLLLHQVHLGTVPTWSELIFALSVIEGRRPPPARHLQVSAPEVSHAVVHAGVLQRARRAAAVARPYHAPRQPVFVRRAALVHDGARRRHRAARERARPRAAVPD